MAAVWRQQGHWGQVKLLASLYTTYPCRLSSLAHVLTAVQRQAGVLEVQGDSSREEAASPLTGLTQTVWGRHHPIPVSSSNNSRAVVQQQAVVVGRLQGSRAPTRIRPQLTPLNPRWQWVRSRCQQYQQQQRLEQQPQVVLVVQRVLWWDSR